MPAAKAETASTSRSTLSTSTAFDTETTLVQLMPGAKVVPSAQHRPEKTRKHTHQQRPERAACSTNTPGSRVYLLAPAPPDSHLGPGTEGSDGASNGGRMGQERVIWPRHAPGEGKTGRRACDAQRKHRQRPAGERLARAQGRSPEHVGMLL